MKIESSRREALKAGVGLSILGVLAAAGLIAPQEAQAEWNKTAFDGKTNAEALTALGAGKPTVSRDVTLTVPDIAENGAVVPMGVATTLPNVEMIAILIEKNPNPLAASFKIPAGTEANVQTRCKMGQTSNVYGLVKAGGKFYVASKEVKVTLGGCGG